MTGSKQEPEAVPDARTDEDRFRDDLRSVIAVVKKLAPLCKSPDDIIGICTLALENDGQLALLWDQLTPIQLRR